MNSYDDEEELMAAAAAFEQDEEEDVGYCLQEEDDQSDFSENRIPSNDEMDDLLASIDLDSIQTKENMERTEPKFVSCSSENLNISTPSQPHLDVLQRYFGHAAFRPMQWRIINAALKGQDNNVVMATGYGKSLCYQFPAVFTGGVAIVVSPLISLMEDQVLGLKASNIEACFLGSAQTNKSEVYSEMMKKRFRVIYVTPEFVTTSNILETLHRVVGITLFAIDEAHCVSQWGHDFRSAYRSLGQLRLKFPSVPVMALTATATPKVIEDIKTSLKLRSPVVTVTSFNRPNLFLEVKLKHNSIREDIEPYLTKDDDDDNDSSGSTIVYCPTKKATEEVSRELKGIGVTCAMYHAGMTTKQRRTSHEQFVRDKVSVIVATIAFGMGINKPDVRKIIHYGAPRDMESYYQEIGRAGRDGLPSVCTVFFSNKDFAVHKYFLNQIPHEQFRAHRLEMQNKMEQYLNITTCRRVNILFHFTNNPDIEPSESCCDNCSSAKKPKSQKKSRVDEALDDEGKYNFTEDARKILSALKNIGETSLGSLILFLKGSNSQRVKDYWKKYSSFGSGKARTEGYWKALGKLLIYAQYLNEKTVTTGGGRGRGWGRGRASGGFNSFSFTVLNLTKQAFDALSCNRPICLIPSSDMKQELKYVIKISRSESDIGELKVTSADIQSKEKSDLSSQMRTKFENLKSLLKETKIEKEASYRDPKKERLQAELYYSLLQVRNQLGDESGFMPYMVASNRTILLLANTMPDTIEKLKQVEGMTEAKVQKFGSQFVNHIVRFCEKNSSSLSFSKPSTSSSEELLQLSCSSAASPSSGWLAPQQPKQMQKHEIMSDAGGEVKELQSEGSHSIQQSDGPPRMTESLSEFNRTVSSKKSYVKDTADSHPLGTTTATQSVNHGSGSLGNTSSYSDNLEISNKPCRTNTFVPNPSAKTKRGVIYDSEEEDNDDDDTLQTDSYSFRNDSTPMQRLTAEDQGGSLNSADRPDVGNLVSRDVEESKEDKYDRIRRENKRKLEESGWINVKNIKSKAKRNSLFKR